MSELWDSLSQDSGSELGDLPCYNSESEVEGLSYHVSEPEFEDLFGDDSETELVDGFCHDSESGLEDLSSPVSVSESGDPRYLDQLFEFIEDLDFNVREVVSEHTSALSCPSFRDCSVDKYEYTQSHGFSTGNNASSAAGGLNVPQSYLGFGNVGSFPQNRIISTSTFLTACDVHGNENLSISIRAQVDDVNDTFYNDLLRISPFAEFSMSNGSFVVDFDRGVQRRLPQNDIIEDVSVMVDTAAPTVTAREYPDTVTPCKARANTSIDRDHTEKTGSDGSSKRRRQSPTCQLGQHRRQHFEDFVKEFNVKTENLTTTLDMQQRYHAENYKRLLKMMPRPLKRRASSAVQQEIAKCRRRYENGQFATENRAPIMECDNASIRDI
jgi:hypothetical protein